MEVVLPDRKSVILCVEDEPIPLLLRKSVLEKFGFEVVPAESAAKALEILDSQPIDLVLTDLLMPGLCGTELAREIKRRKPDVPVVLLSGVNEMPEDAEFADLFISKVEGPMAMCENISMVLKKSHKAAV
jgi:CheY-like chemotaxis protein